MSKYTLFCAAQCVLIYCRSQRLDKMGCLKAIEVSRQQGGYHVADTDVADLRHFLYKSRTTSEFTSPVYKRPYDSVDEQRRLLALYHYVHGQMHGRPQQPHRFLFHVGDYEALLGWVRLNAACW